MLDLPMPGMNGIEVLKALRDLNTDIQVMLLTGRASIKTAMEAARLGAIGVLEKPMDIGPLMEKIREARAQFVAARTQRSREHVEEILRKYGW